MLIILTPFALAAAAAAWAPDTPLGGRLRRLMIVAPARWLSEAGPLKLAATLALVLLLIAAPELALVGAVDLGLYLEALAAVSMLSAQVRVRRMLTCIRRTTLALVRRKGSAGRARARSRRAAQGDRPRRPERQDDEPGRVWLDSFFPTVPRCGAAIA